jgi:hypothetical protein
MMNVLGMTATVKSGLGKSRVSKIETLLCRFDVLFDLRSKLEITMKTNSTYLGCRI